MNNELQSLLIEDIKKANGVVSKAIDLAQQQGPELIREFLVWNAWKYGILCFTGLASLIVCWFVIRRIQKMDDRDRYNIVWEPIVAVTAFIAGTVLVLNNFLTFVQVLVAPRIFLLDYVTSLIKH